jgi:organic radical activating enzyme
MVRQGTGPGSSGLPVLRHGFCGHGWVGIDWLCISPKAGAEVVQRSGNELKLVYPQIEAEAQPQNFVNLEFEHFLLQPLDDASAKENTQAAIDYCLRNPRWKLSLQTHKIIGIA